MNINVYIYLHGNKTQYQVGCKTWSPLTCFVPENLHVSDCSICLWAAAMDSFVLLLNSCKVKWKMKMSDKQTTSPLVGLKPRICCQKHVKNLPATAKLDLKSESAVQRRSSFSLLFPSFPTSNLSFVRSFIHSPPLPRGDRSRSCHVIPMNYWNRLPWIIQQQKMGGGWVCSWLHCGPSKSLSTCYSIFDGHVIMSLMREALLAGRYLISGSFESQRPDWVSPAQINWL